MTIAADVHKYELPPIIELYTLDATGLGAPTPYYFVDGNIEGSSVVWQTHTYTPIPITSEGWEQEAGGRLARPRVSISNVSLALFAALYTWDDLIGAVLTRCRTHRKYLDGEPGADPDQYYPLDVYVVQRKPVQNKEVVTLELAGLLDREDLRIPGRLALKDRCDWIYRWWDAVAGDFDYTDATCPYTGSSYFTDTGASTANPALDLCGLSLSDCRKRFGNTTPLPFGGFPGMRRTKT